MTLGTKLFWRIRPRLASHPALLRVPRDLPTSSHTTLPELLAPWRCRGRTHATDSAAPRPDNSHGSGGALVAPPPTRRLREVDARAEPALRRMEALLTDMPDTAVSDAEGLVDITTTRLPLRYESVMDKVVMRYPAQRETASSYSRYLRKKHGRLRIETRQANHDARMPDWRLVLNMLRRQSPRASWDTPMNSRTIWVQEGIIDTLLHEPDHTLWDIGLRTECNLTLFTEARIPDAAGGGLAQLRLQGSDEAMELAKVEVSRLAHSNPSDSSQSPRSEEPEESTLLKQGAVVWSSSKAHQRPSFMAPFRCQTRFEDLPKPEVWTTRTLETYISSIVRANHPSHVTSELYGSGTDAKLAAISLLQQVLGARETAAALSVRSVHLVLSFIDQVGPACRPQARAVLALASKAGLVLDTPVFNLLLAGNAKSHDLINFQSILHHMTLRGLSPNLDTWRLFLSMIEDVRVKHHICRAMSDLGLLDGLLGRRALAQELVLYDLEQERGRWQGIQPFLARQERKYGPGWMTKPTSGKIMNELGRMGKFTACIEFLDILLAARRPDVVMLNTMLNHAKHHRSTVLAIIALYRMQRLGVSLDNTSYHLLFGLFRRLHKANCMSIVWRIACLKGKTTFPMRTHVSALYRIYPPILSPDLPMPPPALSHDKPEPMYQDWRDLPTFHHTDMLSELMAVADPTVLKPAEQPSLGSVISALFRKHWPREGWSPARPLYALLADADEADRKLEEQGKERRERSQLAAVSSGSLDDWSEVLTNKGRKISPGVPLLLHQRGPPADAEANPADDTPAPSMVADLGPTIFSRTFATAGADGGVLPN